MQAVLGHNIVRSKSKNRPSLVEFKIQWKGNYENSWHEFADFEHSIETLERYITSCSKAERLRIYKALQADDVSILKPSLRKKQLLNNRDDVPGVAGRILSNQPIPLKRSFDPLAGLTDDS